MDFGIFTVYVIFLFIDIILIYRPVPILAFPIMCFFIYVGISEFYPLANTVLPFNPLLSVFFILICGLGILVNGMDLKS